MTANIALIGAGWWSQGWHLPALNNNPKSNLVAIVDRNIKPFSKLNPNLEPLSVLKEKYKTSIFTSVSDLLKDPSIAPNLDGVIVATPHATHYLIGKILMKVVNQRKKNNDKPLHIFMEKPMTTDIDDAINLFRIVEIDYEGNSQFWLNHSANYRTQTATARKTIKSGRLGQIRHVSSSFACPLKWLLLDPDNDEWNKPSGKMIGNGFGWGQSSHLLAFLFHILPNLKPETVNCRMTHSNITGADLSHSATIECRDLKSNNFVIINMSGTALLPGDQYANPPVAKLVSIEIYGDNGSLHYGGNDRDPESGKLEFRDSDGCVDVLNHKFEFEGYDNKNYGPDSIQKFVKLCCGDGSYNGEDAGSTALDGLRSVQVIDAMYKSEKCKETVSIVHLTNKE